MGEQVEMYSALEHRMPRQKPGRSKQDVGTPWEFIEAVERRFGRLTIDLAATEENKKTPLCITPEADSLLSEWSLYAGNLWLNPPFGEIPRWAEKCRLEAQRGARILFLTPASVGTNWFAEHVYGHAQVLFLRPRITFEGQKDPFPKDLILSVYGGPTGCELWKWK